MKAAFNRQRGFSIVAAVFILVVLSLLAAAMLRLISSGSDSVAREVISARTFMAASSGAERHLKEIFTDGMACTAAPLSYGDMGLLGCIDVEVICEQVTVAAINYYTITSTAQCGPVSQPSTRIVQVQAIDN